MKTIAKMLWSLLPVLCMALTVSCTPDQENGGNEIPNVTKDSTIKLGKTKVDVGLAGGTFLIEYTIENAHQGEKISAEAAESWVNNFNYGITGALGFSVDANNSDSARECLVTVKYRFAEDAYFVVKQGAKENSSFTVEVVGTDYFSYTINIYPDNKTAPYIVMSADFTYILASGLETDQDFYEDDYYYFDWLGSFYGESAVDIMNIRARIGDEENLTIGEGASGVPYVVYMYYFDPMSGAITSDIKYEVVTTKAPELIPASFDVQTTVDSCVVSADVVPSNFEGAFYFDMLQTRLVQDYIDSFDFINTPQEAIKFYWSMAVQDMMFNGGMNGQAIIDYYSCHGTYEDGTPRSHYDFELLADTSYTLFAFAMDENGLCCSEPQLVEVTTGSVPMSNNVITPSVSKVTVQTAYIKFETTNDDYYIAGWEKASDWATYGNTDAERQQYLLANLSYEFIQGNHEQNVIGLEGGTDYILYAFGSRGGVATTAQIFTCPFSTKSTDAGNATIEFVDNGYYAAEDLAELPGWEFFGGDYYSGTFILPLEYHIVGEWQAFYSTIYNWTGRYDLYNDTQYRDGLVWSIDQYGSMNLDRSYSILQNDSYYIIASMVIDTEGQYSEISKFEISTSYDGARTNAEDFAKWWDGDNSGPGLSAKPLFAKKVAKDCKVSKMTLPAPAKIDIAE